MAAIDYAAIPLSAGQRMSLAPIPVSWRTLYPVMKELVNSNASLAMLGTLIACELQNAEGPRQQILGRIHMRINAMRQRLETTQILRLAKYRDDGIEPPPESRPRALVSWPP